MIFVTLSHYDLYRCINSKEKNPLRLTDHAFEYLERCIENEQEFGFKPERISIAELKDSYEQNAGTFGHMYRNNLVKVYNVRKDPSSSAGDHLYTIGVTLKGIWYFHRVFGECLYHV